MSKAEDLLNSLSDEEIMMYSTAVGEEGHIIIGNDRTVTVPDELKKIAVQYDHNVETVTFDCPRYSDGVDMSEMTIYVNYMRPDGYKDAYPCNNIVVDETDPETMHFDWTITRNVTQVSGNLRFLVCVKKTDIEGNDVNHWNSDLCSDVRVGEGLECEEQIEQENPDTITAILTRLDTVEQKEESDPTVPEWAKSPQKPTYTASEVGADAAGTAESKVSAHNVSDTAHNDIRLLVQGLTARLNALADSDDETLDQMSEVVAYIKSNKSLIDAITTSKINVSDIIDNLTTNVSNKPLSAAQGAKLKALIDAITSVELDESLSDNTKAAPAGMVGKLKGDLDEIKNNGTVAGSGVTVAQSNSLWAIIQKAAFAEALTDEELKDFKTAWGITTENIPATGIALDKSTLSFTNSDTQTLIATVEPSNSTDIITWESDNEEIATVTNGVVKPLSNGSATITATCGSVSATCYITVDIAEEEQVTLTSISATYSGSDVAVGTALTDLTDITVTAHYSDGSTANVTDYTLSGEIAEGSNTITVSYSGKTTTFTVVGIAESGGEDFETNGWTNGTAYNIDWIDGYRLRDEDLGEPQAFGGRSITDFMPCYGANRLHIEGSVSSSIFWYDADKNYIAYTSSRRVTGDTVIPTGVSYFRLCVTNENTSAFVATPYRDELMTSTTAWETDTFYRMEYTDYTTINDFGEVEAYTGNRCTSNLGFCYGATTLEFQINNSARMFWYDVDGEYIGHETISSNEVTIPDGAMYFRFYLLSLSSVACGTNDWVKLS